MALALGKRKRRRVVEQSDSSDNGADDVDARTLFQRAFEAKFKPLGKSAPQPRVVKQIDLEEEYEAKQDGLSDWSGFGEDDDAIEVIEHESDHDIDDELLQLEKKAFMTSRPPSVPNVKKPAPRVSASENDAADAANLKNDLALQRLLKESHMLDPSTFQGCSNAVEGKGRLKALDSRLRDLGAKQPVSEQEKMPLAHRKGIKAKATTRETVRRKEAAENGVVLEKAKMAAKSATRRDRGIGAPSVGKFRGGMLKLSSRDVKAISGPKQSDRGKDRRR